MFDTHCHLYESEDPAGKITEFKARGGTAIICNGAGVESSRKAIEMAERFPEVYATVGIHPEENSKFQEPNSKEFNGLLNHKKVVGVGECGLDYREETTDEEKKWQRELFEFNIELAKEYRLPLVVHCRNAFEDAYTNIKTQATRLSGVQLHCWTGDLEWAKKFLDLGCYLSFGGILTFKKSEYLRQIARQIPQERILVETDAPYLAPEPVRGSQNEPANLQLIVQKLAEVRNQTFEEVARYTSQNARRLFGIEKNS